MIINLCIKHKKVYKVKYPIKIYCLFSHQRTGSTLIIDYIQKTSKKVLALSEIFFDNNDYSIKTYLTVDDKNKTNIDFTKKSIEERFKFNIFESFAMLIDDNNKEQLVNAPKTIERLEEISTLRNIQRKMDEEEEEDNDKLKISYQDIELGNLDIHIIGRPEVKLDADLLLDDIEILT